MKLFKRSSKVLFVLLPIILSISPVFAETKQANPSPHNISGRMANCTSGEALVDITSEYSQGMHLDFRGKTPAHAPREIPPDSFTDFSAKYFHAPWTLPFYDTKETKWCLSPLSDKFSLDPMTDIRNLEVLLQYKF
jgi:hypothetical protein